jgi:ribosomal protein L32
MHSNNFSDEELAASSVDDWICLNCGEANFAGGVCMSCGSGARAPRGTEKVVAIGNTHIKALVRESTLEGMQGSRFLEILQLKKAASPWSSKREMESISISKPEIWDSIAYVVESELFPKLSWVSKYRASLLAEHLARGKTIQSITAKNPILVINLFVEPWMQVSVTLRTMRFSKQ